MALEVPSSTPSSNAPPKTQRIMLFSSLLWVLVFIVDCSITVSIIRLEITTCLESHVWLSLTLLRVLGGALLRVFTVLFWNKDRNSNAQPTIVFSAARLEQGLTDPGSAVWACLGVLLTFPPLSRTTRAKCQHTFDFSLVSISALLLQYLFPYIARQIARLLYYFGPDSWASRWEKIAGVRISSSRSYVAQTTVALYSKISLRGDSCPICTDDYLPTSFVRIIKCGQTDNSPKPNEESLSLNFLRFTAAERTFIDGHHFHAKCLDRWLDTNNSCPVCRAGVYRIPTLADSAALLEAYAGELDRIHFLSCMGIFLSADDRNVAADLYASVDEVRIVANPLGVGEYNADVPSGRATGAIADGPVSRGSASHELGGPVSRSFAATVRQLIEQVAIVDQSAATAASHALEDGDINLALALVASARRTADQDELLIS